MWVIFVHSLLFTNVLCSSLYLSHKIRHKSKSSQKQESNNVPNSLEMGRSEGSYEYSGDYSSEASLYHSKESSSEHKVQTLLLKDMGLQKLPDINTMNVSRAEYTKMLKIYKQSVQQSKVLSRLQQITSGLDRSITDHLPKNFNFKPTGGSEETVLRKKRDTTSIEMQKIDRLRLNFTTDHIVQKLHEQHNHTKYHYRDQAVIDATNLELGIRLCPERAGQLFEKHHLSFTLYQLSDNNEGVAMSSHNTHYDDIVADSSEELGETGCYSYWVTFDVTSIVQAWLVKPEANHGIRVECKGCSDAGVSMVKDTTKLHINDVYIIKAKYLPRTWKRESRNLDKINSRESRIQKHRKGKDCKVQSGASSGQHRRRKQRCCRQKMPVNVKEMTGFSFILQPVSFDAHFCQGSCPARYNPINEHSLLQSLMHIRTRLKSKNQRIPRPCCTPKKLLPLEILHLDDEDNTKLRVTHWKDVIVSECGCS